MLLKSSALNLPSLLWRRTLDTGWLVADAIARQLILVFM
jgi:hypothetical protein